MKKFVVIFLCFILALSACACSSKGGSIMESPVEDFEYEFHDGSVEITGYLGSDLRIVIPSEIENRPVTEIGYDAFEYYDMECIVIPDTVTYIATGAFSDCDCLKEVVLSNNLSSMGDSVFSNCDMLENIVIPDSVTYIGDASFIGCYELKNVTMSQKLFDTVKDNFIGDWLYTGIFAREGVDLSNSSLRINGIHISEFQ